MGINLNPELIKKYSMFKTINNCETEWREDAYSCE